MQLNVIVVVCSYDDAQYSIQTATQSDTVRSQSPSQSWMSSGNEWTTGGTTERSSVWSLGEDVSSLRSLRRYTICMFESVSPVFACTSQLTSTKLIALSL